MARAQLTFLTRFCGGCFLFTYNPQSSLSDLQNVHLNRVTQKEILRVFLPPVPLLEAHGVCVFFFSPVPLLEAHDVCLVFILVDFPYSTAVTHLDAKGHKTEA